METRVELNPEYTERQTEAIRVLRGPGAIELLYGGAKGGGKSHLGCVWMYIEALRDIQRFNIQPRQNPLCLGFMGRMVGRDFKDTTLETWKEIIPEGGYRIKGNPPEIIIGDRVKYLTGGLDRGDILNKFNSAQYVRVFVDQAEETEKEKIRLLRAATHYRRIINGHKIPGVILWTANPRQCWIKTEFIDRIVKTGKYKRHFVRALPSDNPYLGEDYVDVLRDIFADRPELLAAYLHGDWEILAGAEQIIKNSWVKEAFSKTVRGLEKRPRLVCDTARFGDCESVIYYMETSDIEEQIIMPHCRSTELTQKLGEESYKRDNCPIVVEATGADIGACVGDELISQGKQVVIFCPQSRKNLQQKKRHYNLRTEAWSFTARKFAKGQIQLKNAAKEVDIDKLTEQLCTPTYKFRKNRTIVESKDDIYSRIKMDLGRADAFVIGQWSYDKVPVAEENIDEWGRGTKQEDAELADSYAVKSNF